MLDGVAENDTANATEAVDANLDGSHFDYLRMWKKKFLLERKKNKFLSEEGMEMELGESKVISKGSFGKQLWERGRGRLTSWRGNGADLNLVEWAGGVAIVKKKKEKKKKKKKEGKRG